MMDDKENNLTGYAGLRDTWMRYKVNIKNSSTNGINMQKLQDQQAGQQAGQTDRKTDIS